MTLAGIKILDLSRVLAGPYCTQVLADLGATVWKVEPPSGEDTRGWGPPFVAEESAYFLSVNRGKHGLAIDLKDPRGSELVRSLALAADVVIENFKVGDLARYGLAYEQLVGEHPGLVYCSITGFGQNGPRAAEPGYDAAVQALSGLMAMTGEPDRPPVKLGVAWVDLLTGLHAAVAILAALRERDATGAGRRLDVALFDVSLAALVNQAQSALLTGQSPRRLGSAHPNIVPYQAFEAADGAIMVAVGNDRQFRALCEVLDRPGWADDARFATNAARVEHRAALIPMMSELLSGASRERWLAQFQRAGVPATPVNDVLESLTDPQAAFRGAVRSVTHRTAGEVPTLASALRFAGAEGSQPQAPPTLGQDSAAVLTRELGVTAAELDELERDGVVVVDRPSSLKQRR